jgi:hypothetical protein
LTQVLVSAVNEIGRGRRPIFLPLLLPPNYDRAMPAVTAIHLHIDQTLHGGDREEVNSFIEWLITKTS